MAVYDHFGYCGRITNDNVAKKPIVRCIAWCPYPKKYQSHTQDVIAVTGDFGTVIHTRGDPIVKRTAAEKKNLDQGWSILYGDSTIVGRSLTWNPSSLLEAGDLAVDSMSRGDPVVTSKLYLLKIPKDHGAMTNTEIYDAATDGVHDIMSVSWCFSGTEILVFTNSSNTIRYLKWTRETRRWTQYNIPFDDINIPRNLIGCVPTDSNRDIFAVGGINQKIKIFKKSIDQSRPWDAVCTWQEDINVTAMAFSSSGRMLATLSNEGTVRLFRIVLPRVQGIGIPSSSRVTLPPLANEAPSINLVNTWEGSFKFISWSGDIYLLMSGETLDSVQVVEFIAYDGTLRDHEKSDALANGTECIAPFNSVKQLFVCPHRQDVLAVLGYDGCIMFWQNRHHFARRNRDVFLEIFRDHLPEVTNEVDVFSEELDRLVDKLKTQLEGAKAQTAKLKVRYEAVGDKLRYYMTRILEGKHDDMRSALNEIYCEGRFHKKY